MEELMNEDPEFFLRLQIIPKTDDFLRGVWWVTIPPGSTPELCLLDPYKPP
jgi:hypothetical protein